MEALKEQEEKHPVYEDMVEIRSQHGVDDGLDLLAQMTQKLRLALAERDWSE